MPTITLITGANRGIGLELAKQFATETNKVIACCRNPESAEALQALSNTHNITLEKMEVTNEDDVKSVAAKYPSIDLLINNAGIYGERTGNIAEVSLETMQEVLAVNTVAVARVAQYFLPAVNASGRKVFAVVSSAVGSIDNTTDSHGYAYRVSKAAVNMLIKVLSCSEENRAIKFLLLHPGWVQTDMGGKNATLTVEESVSGMKQVLDNAEQCKNAGFYRFDGNTMPW